LADAFAGEAIFDGTFDAGFDGCFDAGFDGVLDLDGAFFWGDVTWLPALLLLADCPQEREFITKKIIAARIFKVFTQIIAATIHREGKETRPYLSCFPVRRQLRQLLLQPPFRLRALEVGRVRKACFPAPRFPSMPLSLVGCSTCGNHTLAACHECVSERLEAGEERIRI